MIAMDTQERNRIIKARWRKRHKERAFAQNKISDLMERGKIFRPSTCSNGNCSETSGIEAHHPDYSKPLIIIWLCRKCHLKHHKNARQYGPSPGITIKGSRITHLDPKRIQKVYDFLQLELNSKEKLEFVVMAEVTYTSVTNFIKYVEKRYKGNIKTSTFEKIEKVVLSIVEKQSADDYSEAVTKVRGK